MADDDEAPPPLPPPLRQLGARLPPPEVPRGSDVNLELSTIAALEAPEDSERWPVSLDPAADTESGNNRRHEAWLNGGGDWPSRENNWLSRQGHPLEAGSRRYVQWTHSYDLEDVVRDEAPPPHRQHSSAASSSSSCSVRATTGSASGYMAKHERTSHLLNQPPPPQPRHVIFGGASESVDIEFARAGGARAVGEAAASEYARKLSAHAQRQHARAVASADGAALRSSRDRQLQESMLRLQPFLEYNQGSSKPLLMKDRFAHTAARAGTNTNITHTSTAPRGYRPGSAAARKANGGRPGCWPA